MSSHEEPRYWTFEAALERAIKDYRHNEYNEVGLPYQASQACQEEALEASWQGDPVLSVQLIADLAHEGILLLGRRRVSEEDIATKVLAPLLEMGLTDELGPEKQRILDRRYDRVMAGRPQVAE